MSLDLVSVARLKAGDIGGLASLVEAYQIQAIRTAYLIVRDRQLAQDITQSAFIRAYERIDQFRSGAPFGPWFLRSVVNDALKAAERAHRTSSLDTGSDGEGVAPAMELVDKSPGPGALLEAAEDTAALWAMLGRLPAKQRAVIVLRYYVGLSDVEIASYLEAPPATVRWRLFAARNRLRALLGVRAD
jgi:RNA polymerase sigma-70 factor (ECF subfamily)